MPSHARKSTEVLQDIIQCTVMRVLGAKPEAVAGTRGYLSQRNNGLGKLDYPGSPFPVVRLHEVPPVVLTAFCTAVVLVPSV